MNSRFLISTAGALGILLASQTAQAAAQTSSEDAQEPKESALGDIVVTAQRRKETLQSVPIAITAMTGRQLEARGVTSALQIAQYVPNMVAMNNTGLGTANVYYIRGLGNTESIPTFDPPVGTYIDDVYMSRQNANNLSMFEVDRVEVLRGPQGTLFGRNTTGGAISVHMAQPSFDKIEGFGEIGYGAYNKRLARASVNVPVSSTFALKLSGYWQNDDGYAHNVTTGERLNNDDGWGVRIAARAELSSSAHWSAGYMHIVADGENIVNFACNPVNPSQCNGRYTTSGYSSAGSPVFAALGITGRKAYFGQGNHTVSEIGTSSLSIDLAPKTSVEFITGFIDQRQQYSLDFYDGRSAQSLANPYPAVTGWATGGYVLMADSDVSQFSQEIKLAGSIGHGLFDYVGGVYYLNEENRTDFADVFTLSSTSQLLLGDRILRNSTRSLAGYFQGDLNLTSALKLTAGIRYTDEQKRLNFQDNRASCSVTSPASSCLTTANIAAAGIPTTLNTRLWTPRFAINYKAGPDLLFYASATKGFKSGGWNARATTPKGALPFNPEIAWTYEAGVKSELFNHKLRANLNFYWMDITGIQIPTAVRADNGTTSFITRNFANMRNYGLEMELQFAPAQGMNVFLNGGYQNAKYKLPANQPAFDAYGTQSVAAQQAQCVALLAAGYIPGGTGTTAYCSSGIVGPTGALADPVRVPKFTVAFGGSYEIPLGSFTITPDINANWRDSYEVGTSGGRLYTGAITGTNGTYPANPYSGTSIGGSLSPAAWMVNVGITLADIDKLWSLRAECQNCLDAKIIESGLGYQYYGMPRKWMARLKRRF